MNLTGFPERLCASGFLLGRRQVKTNSGWIPLRVSITARAAWFITITRSSPFFTPESSRRPPKSAGTTNTDVLSSGTAISQSQRGLQTSCLRVPVFTLKIAI
jgi:hypothetical protein